MTLVGGDRARIRPLLPMIAMAVAAQLSGLVDGYLQNPLLWGLSAALLVCGIVALVGPGDRPSWLLLKVSPPVYLCSATLLILSQTSSPSGLSIILLIPVLAVASERIRARVGRHGRRDVDRTEHRVGRAPAVLGGDHPDARAVGGDGSHHLS